VRADFVEIIGLQQRDVKVAKIEFGASLWFRCPRAGHGLDKSPPKKLIGEPRTMRTDQLPIQSGYQYGGTAPCDQHVGVLKFFTGGIGKD
jgi:hypothetical protein